MKRINRYVVMAGMGLLCGVALSSCKGRTADNMEPTGETVRVVIPESDIAMDSAIAN